MNKVYFILGASSDVGIELIKKINNENESAIIVCQYRSINDELLDIKEMNNNIIDFVKADLTDQNQVQTMILYIKEKYVAPTHIVHLPANKFEYIKLKKIDWDRCLMDLEIQVHSLLSILQAFLPQMIKNEFNAKVVIMLSENTVASPAKYTISYTMVKYALLGMMKSLEVEFKEKKINFNAISPTMLNTKFWSNIDPRLIELNGMKEKMLDVMDVIPTIMFLLSRESDHINGENIHISK